MTSRRPPLAAWFDTRQEVTTGETADPALDTVGEIQESGYDLARMAFEIILAPEAVTALKNLAVPVRTGVTEALERHQTDENQQEPD